jgi:PAS domain-containing protein
VLEQVVRESADGVLAFDADGRVTLWNPSLERLLGVGARDAARRLRWATCCRRRARGAGRRGARDARRAGSPRRTSAPSRPPRGARRGVLEVSYSPLRGVGSAVAGGSPPYAT